jgi:hypothetical protein
VHQPSLRDSSDLINIVTPFNLILRHNTVRSPLVKAFAQALGVDLKAPG